jgi:hypothetical protein
MLAKIREVLKVVGESPAAFSNRRMSLKIGTRFQYRMSLKRILVSNGQ